MKILIIQTAFIGDVVLALPIAQAFNLYLPQAEIHFLVRKGNENLLENHPSIHKIWSWDKKNKWSSVVKLLKAFRKERFTWVINPHRFLSSGIFTVFSKAKYTVGFEKNPLSWLFDYRLKHEIREGLHEAQRNLSLLKPVFNTDVPLIKPKLYPSEADRAKVKMYQKEPYVVLAPASVWYTKQWEITNWIELAQKLSEKYWVYLVGGPSDGELCEKIKSSNERIVNLSGKLTYLQTASLMEKAIRVWVNDSAPLHFATAVNAPVTAIFCSTTPRFGFFPLSDDSKILSDETLKCKPCGLHGKKACPQKHFMCSKSITVDMALQM